MSSEQMKNSFTNCPPCLLAGTAKVASLVAGPPKCYINRLERHIRNRSTNYIAGNSLFSSEIILKLDGDTELARAVDVVMARAKIIYILIIKGNKLLSFFSSRCFLKEMGNMYSVFLSSPIQTLVKVWENSKKLRKYSPAARVPTAFLVLPNFHALVFGFKN